MTKTIIVSVEGADYFILNGINRPRSYEAIGVNLLAGKKGVKLIPVQRDETTIQDTILFNEFLIDGEIPDSQENCISILNKIVFKKGGGNGVGVADVLIIPIGKSLIFKRGTNTPNDLEADDLVMRIVENKFIQGTYIGGNESLLSSYDYDTSINF